MTRRRLRATILLWFCTLAAGCIDVDPAIDPVSPPGDIAGKGDRIDGEGAGDKDGEEDGSLRLVSAVDVSHWTRTLTDPEVDCLWEAGVRHVIAGTQSLDVTRQQLAIALRGGMTVDTYVFLHWERDVTAQVQAAVDLAAEFPIGRVWLDVEDDPDGRDPTALRALIDEALAAAGSVRHGIYTARWWWAPYLEDTTDYADVALWYARYDGSPDLAEWHDPEQDDRFGGWTSPTAKQYDDHLPGLCALAVDDNVMWSNAQPQVVVDRAPSTGDGAPPEAPVALWPDVGFAVATDYVKPTAPSVRDATGYELEVEVWSADAGFAPYGGIRSRPTSDLLLFPQVPDTTYRWRIRAGNPHGPGPWSAWAWFEFGRPSTRPSPEQIAQ
jgi:hypothetical protein